VDERPTWPRPEDDDDTSTQEPTEGIRIIGAEEAAEAIERGDVAPRRPEGAPRFGDRPSPPPDDRRPALRFPLGSGATADVTPEPQPATPAPGLPHWTEPPTGEVPRILPHEPAGDEGLGASASDDLEAWSTFAGSAPRWRDHDADWAASDFEDGSLLGEDGESPLGALDESDRLAPDDFFGEAEVVDEPPPTRIRTGPQPRQRTAAPRAARAGARAAVGRSIGVADRDVRIAVITGVALAVLAFGAFALGPAPTALLVGVILVVTAAELFDALRRGGHQPATLLGLAATGSFVAAAYWRGVEAYPLVLALTVIVGLLWYIAGVSRTAPTANLGVTLLGVGWVGGLGSFAALLLTFPDRRGIAILLGAVIATVAHDVGSLVVGRAQGRSAMAPTISPAKTWEGLIGGTVASVLVSVLVLGWILPGVHPWDVGSALALGVVVSIVAPLGDLAESLVKRDLGIKDMGSVLPGHGGLMDRFDALLFVLPAVYYLARVLELAQ
jgi:phosphatidate cytidylyltransferase